MPPEPHRVVFWSCTWGINIAHLVWQFCLTLQWPAPLTPATPNNAGISWTELAISFMLWAGRLLPIKLSVGPHMIAVDSDDRRVQLQPPKKRSLRVLSETFRLIVKHIQTFPIFFTFKNFPSLL